MKPPIRCTPCRVTFNGTRYEVSKDGTVRETWMAVEGGTRMYSEPLGPSESLLVRREAARQRRNRNARERHDALRSLGMVRTSSGAWE